MLVVILVSHIQATLTMLGVRRKLTLLLLQNYYAELYRYYRYLVRAAAVSL